MRNVDLIVDLQFGSTGKGLLAGYLARLRGYDTVICAWAPNAGHTFIDKDETKYIHKQIPNGIVSPGIKHVLIGPGSVIDIDTLNSEIEFACKKLPEFAESKILIHPNAMVLTPDHVKIEKDVNMARIGSTCKGVGAAVIEKLNRNPDKICTAKVALMNTKLERFVVSIDKYNEIVDESYRILIEGAQGFSLGINQRFYPYCTSRECTPAQIMSDCGIPLSRLNEVIGTCRINPIRVANRYSSDGKMIGYSGPCYMDQEEISWDSLCVEPELTTVTKLPRRVFSFSIDQMKESIRMCEPTSIFLNFANYEKAESGVKWYVHQIESLGVKVNYLGWGATIKDIQDISGEGHIDDRIAVKNFVFKGDK